MSSGGNLFRRTLTNEVRKKEINKISRAKREGDNKKHNTMTNHEISYHIRGAAMEVYNTLGPGLLESVYHKALARELENRGLKVKSEVPVEVYYKGELIEEDALRVDIVVEDQVVLELKSVETLMPIHFKQLRTYLRLYNKELGWLINFGAYDFKDGLCSVKLDKEDKI